MEAGVFNNLLSLCSGVGRVGVGTAVCIFLPPQARSPRVTPSDPKWVYTTISGFSTTRYK